MAINWLNKKEYGKVGLPHNLIKDKLIDLIEITFQREGSPYLACSDRNAFFTSEKPKKYHAWSCQNVCDALTFLLDNISTDHDLSDSKRDM